jgi:hypothetical protein
MVGGSFYELYRGQDPISGIQDKLGVNVDKNPGGGLAGIDPSHQPYLSPVAGTNYSYDPISGQYIVGGQAVAGAPNLQQQGQAANALQQSFVGQYGNAMDRLAQTRAGQTQLAGDYRAAIEGRAPSVAQTQLGIGMNRIAADQNSMAAGASGQNAFAARRAAAQNIARASGDLSGQLALTRAAETAAARSGMANIYGQQTQADVGTAGLAAQAGLGYGNLAEEAERDRIGANQRAYDQDTKTKGAIFQGAGSALGAIFGGA